MDDRAEAAIREYLAVHGGFVGRLYRTVFSGGFFRSVGLMALCVLLLLAAGCPGPRQSGSTKGPRGTKAYTINGRTYQPLLSAHGFHEEGTASWYGKDFHGKLTANGERYDMNGMTAAHKLLPFNTQLRVVNKTNGKSITVRVNDRGPFVGTRIIDLTRNAAEQLGMLGPGTAPVVLDTVGEVQGLVNGDLAGQFYVQVGAFGIRSNADGLVARIQAQGVGARSTYSENLGFWRVQVGPYPSLKVAEQKALELKEQYPGNFVVAD